MDCTVSFLRCLPWCSVFDTNKQSLLQIPCVPWHVISALLPILSLSSNTAFCAVQATSLNQTSEIVWLFLEMTDAYFSVPALSAKMSTAIT